MTKAKLSNFTVGDRVELIADAFGKTGMSAEAGAQAVVTGKDAYFGWLRVQWDRNVNTKVGRQMDGNYFPASFKKIDPVATAEFIIAVKKNGKYEPAEQPRVYPSEAQAMAVAHNMATKYGDEFVVFKTLASVTPPPKVSTVVKRFA
jgi:hypothetical protein